MAQKPLIIDAFDFSAAPKAAGGATPGIADAFDFTPAKATYTPEMQATLANLDAENKKPLKFAAGPIPTAGEVLNTAADFYKPEKTDTVPQQIGKAVERVGQGAVSLPVQAVDEATKQIADNVPVPGDSIATQALKFVKASPPAVIGAVAKKLLFDPQAEQVHKGAGEVAQGIETAFNGDTDNAAKLVQGGVTRAQLGLMPIVGPMIANTEEQIATTGKVLGPAIELAGNAALIGAGAQEGGAKVAEKAKYVAAVDDLVRAQVDKANASGKTVSNAEMATARKAIIDSGKPLQDIVDSAAELRKPEVTQNAVEPTQIAEAPAEPTVEPTKEGPTPVHAPEPIGIDAETGLPIYKRNAPVEETVHPEYNAMARENIDEARKRAEADKSRPTEGFLPLTGEERARLEETLGRPVQPGDERLVRRTYNTAQPGSGIAPEGVVEAKPVEPALDAEMRGADPRLSLSVDATKQAAETGNPAYVARTTEAERIGDARADISAQTEQKVQFLGHLDAETRATLAARNHEIHDLVAQHYPEDLASKEHANAVAGKDGAANREVQDVQPTGSGTGAESVQGTGSEGQAGPASEPPVRTPSEAPTVALQKAFFTDAFHKRVRDIRGSFDKSPAALDAAVKAYHDVADSGGQPTLDVALRAADRFTNESVLPPDKNYPAELDAASARYGANQPKVIDTVETPNQKRLKAPDGADIIFPAPKGFKRNPERGAVDPELLISPFTGAVKLTKAVGEAAAEGRGVAAAVGNEKKSELPQGGSPPSGGMKFAGGPPNEPLPKYAGSINLERLATGDEVRRVVLDTYNANKTKFDEARKPGTTFEQTKREAAELGWDVQKTVDALKRGKIDAARITAARQVTLAQNEAVRGAQKAYAEKASTENFLKLQEELAKSATINQAMQGASAEAGRTLNAHKIFAEAAKLAKTNQEKALANVQKLLGDKWRETADSITEALARIPENDTAALNRFVRNYKQFTTADKVYAYWVANVLSGVQTNVKNLAGNLVMPPIETTVKVIKGVIDPKHTVKEATASVAGRVQGAQQGFTAAMDILRNGMTAEQAAKLEIPRHYEFTGWAKAWNVPGRLLSASDAFFKSTAISGELRAEATRIAFNEGAKGQALDARVKQLLENPTEAMVNKAVEQSKFETFTSDPGKWTKAYIQFRDSVPPIKYVTPFVNVPINLLKRGVELTPGNFLKLADPKVWREGKASDAFARATIGTAIAIYAANKYASGELTGKAPVDAGQRDAFLRTRQEYSVKVGNRWVKYTDFGPLAIPFLSAAAIGDATQTNKNFPAEQVATEAIGSLARGIYDQSFYKGLSDMMDTFGSGKGQFADAVGKQASGTVGGLVPFSGFLRSVKNTVDPTFRQPDNIYERIKSGLPIASESVPSRLNALGEEQNGSRLNGIFGFGLRDTKVPNLDIEKEIARLEITPKTPDKTLSIASRQFDLNRDQQRELTALLGDARKQVLRQLFSNQLEVTVGKGDTRASGTYGELDDEQKRAAINNVLGDAYDAALDEFVTRVNQRKESVKEKPKKAKLQFVGAE